MRPSKGRETQRTEQSGEPGVEELLRLAQAANRRGIARRRRRFRRRALALILVAAFVVGVVAVVRFGFGAADDQKPKPTVPGAVATGSIPEFVWVAAKGAKRYQIEFVRGTRVIHMATTGAARLHVAAGDLPPGSYRWRVWALDESGARVGKALVDAAVTIR